VYVPISFILQAARAKGRLWKTVMGSYSMEKNPECPRFPDFLVPDFLFSD
jgi:hypothetical protein